MSRIVSIEHLSKAYRLGQIGTGTLTNDLRVWWAKKRGKPNPLLKIGQMDNGNVEGEVVWALKDVNLDIEEGEVLGIVGRNGAGKSTLLKILSRITAPTSGQIKVKGTIASLLEVGTGFHPELTGSENIYLNGAILGMSKGEVRKKFDEIITFAEVEKFIDTPVKRYSSGMYVRLAFAVAAHLEPDILIVDEVLAVGDTSFQRKCVEKMGQVAKEGRTVLFVSHNMGMIQSLCKRGIILDSGHLVASDNVEAIVGQYLSKVHDRSNQTLVDYTKRPGLHQTWLEKVLITGGEGSSTLVTGRPASFEFTVSRLQPMLECAFTIYDDMGYAISKLNSVTVGLEDQVSIGNRGRRFICRMDELLLLPGTYRINVAISSDRNLQDHVEGAAVFNVEPGHFRGKVVSEKRSSAKIVLPHHWIIPQEEGRLE
jgi:lipopolysaccharide transport system ATP-binding protein